MSLRVALGAPLPDETVRLARAAFPKGNVFMQRRETLGPLFVMNSLLRCFPLQGNQPKSPPDWLWCS